MIDADHISRARTVRLEDELAHRGVKLKRAGAELFGPCPVCGGRDRFSINVKKQMFNCRGCATGGDVIKLVQHVDGCSFSAAIETLVGGTARATPKPAPARRHDGGDDKHRESQAAWLWAQRKPITEDTPPALYLRKRGFTGPIPATLGYLPARDPYPAAMIAAFAMVDEPGPGSSRRPTACAVSI